MKKSLFFVLLILSFLFSCGVKQHKIAYNIPPETDKADRKRLMLQLEHGKLLYLNYCSSCHGIGGNGKDSIPNFSKQQFDAYSVKVLSKPTPTHSSARLMQPDDLMDIFVFLQHYKRR